MLIRRADPSEHGRIDLATAKAPADRTGHPNATRGIRMSCCRLAAATIVVPTQDPALRGRLTPFGRALASNGCRRRRKEGSPARDLVVGVGCAGWRLSLGGRLTDGFLTRLVLA